MAGAEIAVLRQVLRQRQNKFNKMETLEIENGNDSVGQEFARFCVVRYGRKIHHDFHLVHKGFPTDKFSYTVEIEGEFAEDEMKDLASKGVERIRLQALVRCFLINQFKNIQIQKITCLFSNQY